MTAAAPGRGDPPAGTAVDSRCWFWEDFTVGRAVDSCTTTIGPADLAQFAALTGDHNPAHDPAAGVGPVLVHGLLGMSIAVGLIERTGIHHGSTIAMLGISSWSFPLPVHLGTRLRARMLVTAARPSRQDPRRGIVERHLALLDDSGRVLQEGTMTLLVRRRPRRGVT